MIILGTLGLLLSLFIIAWQVLYTFVTLSPFILLLISLFVLSISETVKLLEEN